MARLDPHSYADESQARTRSFDFNATVDFEARVLHATITLELDAPARGGPLDLDTRGLLIESASVPFTLHAPEPILGARLTLELPAGAKSVTVKYRTEPDASA